MTTMELEVCKRGVPMEIEEVGGGEIRTGLGVDVPSL